MTEQKIYWVEKSYEPIAECIRSLGIRRIFLVCGKSAKRLAVDGYLWQLSESGVVEIVKFSDFEPNPDYQSVMRGAEVFRESGCNFILAVGGGSAIDTAKCIKLFACAQLSDDALPQDFPPSDVPLAAIPTTAGSGSESTRFAVIYLNGKKQSVTDDSIIPEYVFLDSGTLKTLPDYQKKSTMLDALCHAVEAYWSINATEISREFSSLAIRLIFDNADGYLCGEPNSAREMMKAANFAGRAINIAQTTAAHALSYKLTSVFGIAHGQAVFICLLGLLSRLGGRTELCAALDGLTAIMGVDVGKLLSEFYSRMNLETPVCLDENIIRELAREVNTERLNNFPIQLTKQEIEDIYREILRGDTLK